MSLANASIPERAVPNPSTALESFPGRKNRCEKGNQKHKYNQLLERVGSYDVMSEFATIRAALNFGSFYVAMLSKTLLPWGDSEEIFLPNRPDHQSC